jgi:hypothetical protein
MSFAILAKYLQPSITLFSFLHALFDISTFSSLLLVQRAEEAVALGATIFFFKPCTWYLFGNYLWAL